MASRQQIPDRGSRWLQAETVDGPCLVRSVHGDRLIDFCDFSALFTTDTKS